MKLTCVHKIITRVLNKSLVKSAKDTNNKDKDNENQANIITKPLQVNSSNRNTDKFLKQFDIPKPTRSLLWITDENVSKIKDSMSFIIEFRTTPKKAEKDKYNFYAEPSLIWTRLPIQQDSQHMKEPFYYPSYPRLTPKQRWEYLNWLKDITQETNLSYVFLYYYGLERHLLFGNYDEAVREIFLLIEHHNKRSFVRYAISALIAASAHKKRFDIIKKYPEIVYELTNESMYLRLLSGADLTIEDIINLFNQKKVNRNHHVIKLVEKYPDLFKKELTKVFNDYVISNGGLLDKLKSSHLEKRDAVYFANTSFASEIRTFKTVKVLYNKELQANIRKIISDTYKKCKLLINTKKVR